MRIILLAVILGVFPLVVGGRVQAADVTIDVNESITVLDSVALIPPGVDVDESITVSDSVGLVPPAVDVNESITVSDSPQLVPPAVVVGESVVISDEAALALAPAVISVAESISVEDQISSIFSAAFPIGVLSEQVKFTGSGGAAGDELGRSVAISGNTAVLGAPFADPGTTTDAGAAHVFVRSGTTWSQQATLVASDATDDDNFGTSVAIYGDTIVVGAEFEDALGVQSGSAYVFTRSGTTWTEQAKLLADDGEGFDQFGSAVAISDDTIVVGAQSDNHPGFSDSGSAYIFVGSGSTWTEQAKLVPSDAAGSNQIGDSVDIDGDTVVIGAPVHTHGVSQSGSVYVFVRSGTTWTEQAELLASAPVSLDRLGNAVGISGDTVVVGAELADNTGGAGAGSAYVYFRTGTTWSEQAVLIASDAGGGDAFGSGVAVNGDTVLVGAKREDDPISSGSLYVYVREGTIWTEQQKVKASDADSLDEFGRSVALSGNTVLVGANLDDDLGSSSGSAYIFHVVDHPPTFDAPPTPFLGTTLTVIAGASLQFNVQVSDVDVGGTVAQIALGTFHTCALLNAGTVRCWGAGGLGRLGSGNNASILDAALAGDLNVGGTVTQITAGKSHTCALLDTGAVRCWGYGLGGRVGYGNVNDIGDNEATATAGDVNVGGMVTQITAGQDHTCALLDTGAVRCWGLGASGRLGYGNTNDIGDNETPATAGDVDVGGTVIQIDAGVFHICALLDTGAVRCWGAGGTGRLGYGNSVTIGDDETPATAGDVDVGGTVAQIVTGSHTCALLDTGAVRCWGSGTDGKLGYGNTTIIGDNETPASAGDVNIVDPGDVVTLGVVGLPAGALFATGTPANPVSATFTWVPTGADVGSYTVTFTAQDGTDLSAPPHVINIEVQQPKAVPGVTPWAVAVLAGAFVLLLAWRWRRRAVEVERSSSI